MPLVALQARLWAYVLADPSSIRVAGHPDWPNLEHEMRAVAIQGDRVYVADYSSATCLFSTWFPWQPKFLRYDGNPYFTNVMGVPPAEPGELPLH